MDLKAYKSSPHKREREKLGCCMLKSFCNLDYTYFNTLRWFEVCEKLKIFSRPLFAIFVRSFASKENE